MDMITGEPYIRYNISRKLVNSSVSVTEDDLFTAEKIRYRLIPFTTLAAVGIIVNIVSLLAMRCKRTRPTVHDILLTNLAVCDMTGSVFIWSYNNFYIVFPEISPRPGGLSFCVFVSGIIVGPFLLALCNSILALLMLALNQYIAICKPLVYQIRASRGSAKIAVYIAWGISFTIAIIPTVVILLVSHWVDCTAIVHTMSVRTIEVCCYALAVLVIVNVAMYINIYRIVANYRKYSQPIVRQSRNTNTENNHKAFITTVIMTGVLIILWVPFMVFHFLSAHVNVDSLSDTAVLAKFYVVDFLPLLVFITNPIIYGVRMREVRVGYQRVFSRIFPCVPAPRVPAPRGSTRMSHLDALSMER